MTNIPATEYYWRNVGDSDSSWTLDADGTFTPAPGQRVEVVAFGASLPAQITADTNPAISGLSNVAETANGAIAAIDVSGNATGTNLNYGLSGVSWMAIDAAGVITGNAPNENRTDTVTVTVTNSAGSASDSFDIALTGAVLPVAANWTGSLPALNAAYGAAFTVNTASSAAGDAPRTYGMSGAPVWMSINTSTGQITGTAPNSDVTTTATITVTNAYGSDSTALDITVSDAALSPVAPLTVAVAPSLNTIPEIVGSTGDAGGVDLRGYLSAGTAPVTFTLSGQPAWLSVSGSVLTWDATSESATGRGAVVVTATNSQGSDSTTLDVSLIDKPQTNAHTTTIAANASDPLLFDSGFIRGPSGTDRNDGQVPLSGVMSAGGAAGAIEARAVSLDDGGVTSTEWQQVATLNAAETAWTGTLSVPRSSSQYRVEARVVGSSVSPVLQAGKIEVGHRVVWFGQSEHQRTFTSNSFIDPPAVVNPGYTTVTYADYNPTSFSTETVTDANPVTGPVVVLSNMFQRMRPGDRFHIVAQLRGASNLGNLVDSSDSLRLWSDDKTILENGTGGPGMPGGFGFMVLGWTTGPGFFGADWAEQFVRFFTKADLDGNPMSAGDTWNAPNGGSITYDNFAEDMSADYASMPVLPQGAHHYLQVPGSYNAATYDPNTDTEVFAGPETNQSGGDYPYMALRRMATQSAARMNTYGAQFYEKGGSVIAYQTGDDETLGQPVDIWADLAHPGNRTPDGQASFISQAALLAGEQIGWVPWDTPRLDASMFTWSANYVTLNPPWPISTTHVQRGGADSEVGGFSVNSKWANAELMPSGEVRIYHPDGVPFGRGDELRYGMGGALDGRNFRADIERKAWQYAPIMPLDLPSMGVSQAVGSTAVDLPGISVERMLGENEAGNDMPMPTDIFYIPQTASFLDQEKRSGTTTADSGLGSQITVRMRFRVTNPFDSVEYLFRLGGFGDTWMRLSGTDGEDRLFVRASDSSGTIRYNDVLSNGLTISAANPVWHDLVLAIDMEANKLWVTDLEPGSAFTPVAVDWIGAGSTGLITQGNGIELFPTSPEMECTGITVWKTCTADGSPPPLAEAMRVIAGTPAQVNAHDWLFEGAVT
jgi:hypothetical protein